MTSHPPRTTSDDQPCPQRKDGYLRFPSARRVPIASPPPSRLAQYAVRTAALHTENSRPRRRPPRSRVFPSLGKEDGCAPAVCARARAPKTKTSFALSGAHTPMQSSTSTGRQSLSRIEPWAIPSELTYVNRIIHPRTLSSYLEQTSSKPRALDPGDRRRVWSARGRHPCHNSTCANWEHLCFSAIRSGKSFRGG